MNISSYSGDSYDLPPSTTTYTTVPDAPKRSSTWTHVYRRSNIAAQLPTNQYFLKQPWKRDVDKHRLFDVKGHRLDIDKSNTIVRDIFTKNVRSLKVDKSSGDIEFLKRHAYEISLLLKMLVRRKKQFANKCKEEEKKVMSILKGLDVDLKKCRSFDTNLKENFYKSTGYTLVEFENMAQEMVRHKEEMSDSDTSSYSAKQLTYQQITQFLDQQGEKDIERSREFRRQTAVSTSNKASV